MSSSRWIHVLGNTWCLDLSSLIPVYFLNAQDVVLLDSGYKSRDRDALVSALQEKDLRVRAIIGSHSHSDHNENHHYFQENHGSEIILRDIEALIVSDYPLMTLAYAMSTPRDMEQYLSPMLVHADRTFSEQDADIRIDGHVFGLIPLPGHTPGHTGIVTPDQVLFLADAVISEDLLPTAKIPATDDWAQDIATKRMIQTLHFPRYILSHKGIYHDIKELTQHNIEDKLERAEMFLSWLKEQDVWSISEIEEMMWKKFDLRSRDPVKHISFRRNVHNVLMYLEQQNRLERTFQQGTYRYRVNESAMVQEAPGTTAAHSGNL